MNGRNITFRLLLLVLYAIHVDAKENSTISDSNLLEDFGLSSHNHAEPSGIHSLKCPLYPEDGELSELSFCVYLFPVDQDDFEIVPPSAYLTHFWPKFRKMVAPVCESSESSHGASYFFLDDSQPPVDVFYFCSRKSQCAHLRSLPNSETCIFHANKVQLTAGPLQVGQFANKWELPGNSLLREKLLDHSECFSLKSGVNSSRCWTRMTVEDFEVLCCCYGELGDCAPVARNPRRIAIAHDLYASWLPGRTAPDSSAREMFKNTRYHCAMMHAAHDHSGAYELEGSRSEVQYIGGESCGAIFTSSPTSNDRFRVDFRAGSYNSFCFNNLDSARPVFMEPECPFDVVPGIPIRILYCCRGHYCNHPKVLFPRLNLLAVVQAEHMLTTKQCPVTYAELLSLFLATRENGVVCRIHFDTVQNRTVPLIENVNMVNVAYSGEEQMFEMESTDGTKVNVSCILRTVRYVDASECPHHQAYEPIDSPLRKLMTCTYRVPDLTSETFDMRIDMAELYSKSSIKQECVLFSGFMEDYTETEDKPLPKIDSRSSICYFKLGYKGNLYIEAGTVEAVDDTVDPEQEFLHEMYLEHFVSQVVPNGFLTTYDKRQNVVYYLCSSQQSLCNLDEAGIDVAETILTLNFANEAMDFGWTCNSRECELDLGCFRVESITSNQTQPVAGCVSDIPMLIRHRPDLGFLTRCYQSEQDVGCQTTINEVTKEVLVYCCCRFACQEEIYDKRGFWIAAHRHDDTLRITQG